MKVYFDAIVLCVAIALSIAPSALAGSYIIGKKEDETLLILSIAFVVICGLFLLVSIVATLMMFRRASVSWARRDYSLDDMDVRYQSMYSSKQNRDNMPESQYEQLKLREPSNGFYQSPDDTKESGQQNNNKDKQGTPQGKENRQGDASKTESKTKPMSSFQNPAYQSTSMNSGLDVAKDSETPL